MKDSGRNVESVIRYAKPIDILVLASDYPPHGGGIANVMSHVSHALKNYYHIIVAPKVDGHKKDPTNVHRLPLLENGKFNFRASLLFGIFPSRKIFFGDAFVAEIKVAVPASPKTEEVL